MIEDQDREMARQAAHLFGGNGLSQDQQVELVAAKLAEWRESCERMARADEECNWTGMHPIHQR